ncbi:MAG: DUF4249 domain-containing protein [Bacteroidales bacterium]|nr:DUF4249 domain-containing protein [Bacteroidales bacterium]
MKKKHTAYLVLSLVIATACTDTIDNFTFKDIDPKIVVHGAISIEGQASVNISRSLSLNEPAKYYPLERAKIRLLQGNEESAVLTYDSNGWYSAKNFIVQTGTTYTITAENDGYERATVDFDIPEKPVVSTLSWRKIYEESLYQGRSTYIEISANLKDNPATDDYYTISMGGRLLVKVFYVNGNELNYYYGDDYDSVGYKYKDIDVVLGSSDKAVKVAGNYGRYSLADPQSDITNGDELVLSDEHFKEAENTIQLKVFPSNFYSINGDIADTTHILWLNIAKVNRTYFTYALNSAKVQETSDNPLVEPITPFNPVEGGLGLVYGFSLTTDTIKVQLSQSDIWGWYYFE